MRPISAYISTQKLSLLVAAFFTLSVLTSIAAVVRGGGRPVSFDAQQIKYTLLGKEPPFPQYSPPPVPETLSESAPEYKYFHEAGDNFALARNALFPIPD